MLAHHKEIKITNQVENLTMHLLIHSKSSIHISACNCDIQGTTNNASSCNSNGQCSCKSSEYYGAKCQGKIYSY